VTAVLKILRDFYDREGIAAERFRCRHEKACRGAGGTFTTAKESYVGLEYERGTLPRLLFLSLDSGSSNPVAAQRTLEAVRRHELAEHVDGLHKGKHWYLTHELAWVLLRQFLPTLTVATTSTYFAHVNSAKCCMNNRQNKQADKLLFDNCRQFAVQELTLLSPDIIVSQGDHARRVMMEFRPQRILDWKCQASLVRCGGRDVLWFATYHPNAWGLFHKQKRECWPVYESIVGEVLGERRARYPGARLVKRPPRRKR
jgi:uracil-DNA glycosylase family 4